MHDNDNSIHQFDFSLICEYFSSLHRQGPGSEAATLRALSFLPPLAQGATAADVGCGTGASTMVLAQSTAAQNQRREVQLYGKYHEYYGYTFFIAQKR